MKTSISSKTLYKGVIKAFKNGIKPNIQKINQLDTKDNDSGKNIWKTFKKGTLKRKLWELNFTTPYTIKLIEFTWLIKENPVEYSGKVFARILYGLVQGLTGLTKEVDFTKKDSEEIEITQWKHAFEEATNWAYGTFEPVKEGTILTLVREIRNSINEKEIKNYQDLSNVLTSTNLPNYQSLLKDSGARAFIYWLEELVKCFE